MGLASRRDSLYLLASRRKWSANACIEHIAANVLPKLSCKDFFVKLFIILDEDLVDAKQKVPILRDQSKVDRRGPLSSQGSLESDYVVSLINRSLTIW